MTFETDVSIHAPVKGAMQVFKDISDRAAFQFTHP